MPIVPDAASVADEVYFISGHCTHTNSLGRSMHAVAFDTRQRHTDTRCMYLAALCTVGAY